MEGESGAPGEGAVTSRVSGAETAAYFGSSAIGGSLRRYFVGVFLSAYGDWLTTVALVVVLLQLTRNPAGPAGYMLVRVAPRVLGPWLGGTLTDRTGPRRIMVVAASVQAVCTVLLIPATASGALWAIFAVVGAAQFVGALSRPSQGAMLPKLVSDRALPRANAIYWLFSSSSIFVAPAIGAVLLTHTGPRLLFAIDATTFAVSAILFFTLPARRGGAEPEVARHDAERSTMAGIRLALREPVIRTIAAANFCTGVAVTTTQAVLVVAANERYGGPAAVGYLYAAVGVGGTLGGVVALRAVPPRQWVRPAVFLVTVAELVALAGFSTVSVLAPAFALLAASALAGSSFDIWGGTEMQRLAPPGYMGRFNSVIWLAQYSGLLLGALWALGSASIIRWDAAIQVACAAMLALVIAALLAGGTTRAT